MKQLLLLQPSFTKTVLLLDSSSSPFFVFFVSMTCLSASFALRHPPANFHFAAARFLPRFSCFSCSFARFSSITSSAMFSFNHPLKKYIHLGKRERPPFARSCVTAANSCTPREGAPCPVQKTHVHIQTTSKKCRVVRKTMASACARQQMG